MGLPFLHQEGGIAMTEKITVFIDEETLTAEEMEEFDHAEAEE